MWVAPLVAVAAEAWLVFTRPAALGVGWPLLGLWFSSPFIAWWVSRPIARREARLTADQTIFLRKLSRKTWAFFETFVGPEDNWLPPDNYQEQPVATVAHRTSPTNMGLALLSNLSAYDFGYIVAGQLIERTENAFKTMDSLEKHRGHFYNWYDTRSLKPLLPTYISSVDSGNLAGHLLTLRPGLLALYDQKILGIQLFDGLRDTAMVLAETLKADDPVQGARLRLDMESACSNPPDTLPSARLCLERLAASAAEAAAVIKTGDGAGGEGDAAWWANAFAGQCRAALDELLFLAPWTSFSGSFDSSRDFPAIVEIPTLRQLAGLEEELLHTSESLPDELKGLIQEASLRARQRIAASSPAWTMTFCMTGPVTCSASGIMPANGGGTRVITTCWRPRRGCPVLWGSPRDNCRRRAGSRWDAC